MILLLFLRKSPTIRCFYSSVSSTSSSTSQPISEFEKLETKERLHNSGYLASEFFELDGRKVKTDSNWNLSPGILRLFQRRLLTERGNPLNLLKQQIINHFHNVHRKAGSSSPLFAVCENEPRLVSTFENFDSLLTPSDHISRRTSDTYYVNEGYCLRAHTSAHQFQLLKQGFDNFIVPGDVYRRDEIDRTHYPCFHQIEGVRTYTADELFGLQQFSHLQTPLFEEGDYLKKSVEKQAVHSLDAAKVLQIRLKSALEDLCLAIFGYGCEMRWIDAYFPFTHPSFELEVNFEGQWLEVLGCGVMEQQLLKDAGVGHKVGWAFGLGLERLAMVLYGIPDIRLFWSRDSGFLSQFADLKPYERHTYKPISAYPQLTMDLSFWLPPESTSVKMRSNACDVIRSVGDDLIEQFCLIDEFSHPKTKRQSHTYRIVYRSNEKALTKEEINILHRKIQNQLVSNFSVIIR